VKTLVEAYLNAIETKNKGDEEEPCQTPLQLAHQKSKCWLWACDERDKIILFMEKYWEEERPPVAVPVCSTDTILSAKLVALEPPVAESVVVDAIVDHLNLKGLEPLISQ